MRGKSKKIGLLVIACIILVLFIVISIAPSNSNGPTNRTENTENSNDAYKAGSGGTPTTLITDINGPFSIAYAGVDTKGFYHMQVSDSSPGGRQAAIKWLENAGYDISTLVIDFVDFNNPLKPPKAGL
jgi:hypothetical protein